MAYSGPVPMDDAEWEDIEPEDIPAHLKPPSGTDYLTVVDVSGIHFLTVNFCTCPASPPEYIQLLQCRLFPSTLKTMSTVFTFQVLDDFIRDNLECGTSAMNYYSKLRRVTSNVFPHLVPVCVSF
jgi:CxC2 like cysteine cluster associated with KDZ transposases